MMRPDMQGMIFDDADTQEIYNDWLEDFPTWMIPDKQQEYLRLVEAADEKAKEKKGKGKEKGKEKKGKGAGPGQKAHQCAEAHSVHTNSRLLGTSTWCTR